MLLYGAQGQKRIGVPKAALTKQHSWLYLSLWASVWLALLLTPVLAVALSTVHGLRNSTSTSTMHTVESHDPACSGRPNIPIVVPSHRIPILLAASNTSCANGTSLRLECRNRPIRSPNPALYPHSLPLNATNRTLYGDNIGVNVDFDYGSELDFGTEYDDDLHEDDHLPRTPPPSPEIRRPSRTRLRNRNVRRRYRSELRRHNRRNRSPNTGDASINHAEDSRNRNRTNDTSNILSTSLPNLSANLTISPGFNHTTPNIPRNDVLDTTLNALP